MRRTLTVALLLSFTPVLGAAEPFLLHDGDRVVLIGNTLIEREQKYGYWETALTAAFPDANVTFRNLGWSGDTVWGESRAGFDTPQDGYRRLVEKTLAEKPTVMIVGYGTNESFAGEAGLPAFRAQLNKLLDDLSPSKARVVLLALPPVAEARQPKGAPAGRERQITLYSDAIREVAKGRQARFADPFARASRKGNPLTDDGMHLTAFGYSATATGLAEEITGQPFVEVVPVTTISLNGTTPFVRIRESRLPSPLPPPWAPGAPGSPADPDCAVNARGLKPGRYDLKIDGRVVTTADAREWMGLGGLAVRGGPSLEQAEKLRQTIVEKNRQYFYRWRPQNETYLFGFRRNEQGQNAKEIPLFDPIIEKLEKEIARLRLPVEHVYQLSLRD